VLDNKTIRDKTVDTNYLRGSITHFSKGGPGASKKALYRFIGSIAFTAAPRAAFVVLEDSDDKARRLFLHGKNNLAKPAQGLAFHLAQAAIDDEAQIIASHVVWATQSVSTTADEAISTNGKREITATDDALSCSRLCSASCSGANTTVSRDLVRVVPKYPDRCEC
jgi:hypothetical protein